MPCVSSCGEKGCYVGVQFVPWKLLLLLSRQTHETNKFFLRVTVWERSNVFALSPSEGLTTAPFTLIHVLELLRWQHPQTHGTLQQRERRMAREWMRANEKSGGMEGRTDWQNKKQEAKWPFRPAATSCTCNEFGTDTTLIDLRKCLLLTKCSYEYLSFFHWQNVNTNPTPSLWSWQSLPLTWLALPQVKKARAMEGRRRGGWTCKKSLQW